MLVLILPGYDLIDDDEQDLFENRNLNHVNTFVRNVEASNRFYCGELGNE